LEKSVVTNKGGHWAADPAVYRQTQTDQNPKGRLGNRCAIAIGHSGQNSGFRGREANCSSDVVGNRKVPSGQKKEAAVKKDRVIGNRDAVVDESAVVIEPKATAIAQSAVLGPIRRKLITEPTKAHVIRSVTRGKLMFSECGNGKETDPNGPAAKVEDSPERGIMGR
jgi:hypothetical protein